MSELHTDWKELKQGLGTFVNRIEGMMNGATNIEEVKRAAYEKGLKESATIEKEELCKACSYKKFYMQYCRPHYDVIKEYSSLDYKDRVIVHDIIKRMLEDQKYV